MNPGQLKHKIDIEVEATTQNSYGEPTQIWSSFLSGIFVSIEPLSGREFFAADMVQSEITHKVKMRYISGILPKMRIKYGSRYFYIESVINVKEINKELLLMCRELM